MVMLRRSTVSAVGRRIHFKCYAPSLDVPRNRETIKGMPRYEYKCPGCEWFGIIWHSMSDDTKRTCEQCAESLEKTVSATNWGPSRFQTQAILTNGQRIDGHFGRVARTNRNKWG